MYVSFSLNCVKRAAPKAAAILEQNYFFSQDWLATVQEVLHADWQLAWHSPQPLLLISVFRQAFLIVLICFIKNLQSLYSY